MGFTVVVTITRPLSSRVMLRLNFGIRNVAAVSTLRVLRLTRTTSEDSGQLRHRWKSPDGDGRAKFIGRSCARYTRRPCASNPGVPFCPPMSWLTSFGSGAAIVRTILPFGSMTSIEIDWGSTNSVESPR